MSFKLEKTIVSKIANFRVWGSMLLNQYFGETNMKYLPILPLIGRLQFFFKGNKKHKTWKIEA